MEVLLYWPMGFTDRENRENSPSSAVFGLVPGNGETSILAGATGLGLCPCSSGRELILLAFLGLVFPYITM
jgi:hypothetical protein